MAKFEAAFSVGDIHRIMTNLEALTLLFGVDQQVISSDKFIINVETIFTAKIKNIIFD